MPRLTPRPSPEFFWLLLFILTVPALALWLFARYLEGQVQW